MGVMRRHRKGVTQPASNSAMQSCSSASFSPNRCNVAAVAQLQRPLLDGTFPRFRCLAWLTVTTLALLIAIQLTGAPAM